MVIFNYFHTELTKEMKMDNVKTMTQEEDLGRYINIFFNITISNNFTYIDRYR